MSVESAPIHVPRDFTVQTRHFTVELPAVTVKCRISPSSREISFHGIIPLTNDATISGFGRYNAGVFLEGEVHYDQDFEEAVKTPKMRRGCHRALGGGISGAS